MNAIAKSRKPAKCPWQKLKMQLREIWLPIVIKIYKRKPLHDYRPLLESPSWRFENIKSFNIALRNRIKNQFYTHDVIGKQITKWFHKHAHEHILDSVRTNLKFLHQLQSSRETLLWLKSSFQPTRPLEMITCSRSILINITWVIWGTLSRIISGPVATVRLQPTTINWRHW